MLLLVVALYLGIIRVNLSKTKPFHLGNVTGSFLLLWTKKIENLSRIEMPACDVDMVQQNVHTVAQK